MKALLKKPWFLLLVFGLLYRLVLILCYQHITIFPDSEGYRLMAKMISELDFSQYEGQRSPGYPVLLSLVNNNLFYLIALQLIIGLANSQLVFQNLKLLKFNPKQALLIALFLDSLLHVVFYEFSVLTESFTLFLINCVTFILLRGYFDSKSFKTEFLLGFIMFWLILVKPFYVFLPFVIYGFSILKNFSFKSILSPKILALLFPVTAFFGWSYVNKVHTGYFVPTTFYGFNLTQNCVYFAEKAPKEYAEISEIYVRHREETIRNNGNVSMSIWYAHPDLQKATGLSFPELSAKLNDFSKATIAENLSDYLIQVKTSWLDFWRTAIYWQEDQFGKKETAPVFIKIWDLQHYLLRMLKILFLLNIPLLFYQFLKNRHFSNEIIFTTIILATSFLQAFSTYGTNSRFSYPFEFLMVIVALLQFKTIFGTRKSRNL